MDRGDYNVSENCNTPQRECPFNPQDMGKLMGAVHETNTLMSQGFKAINQRLDISNGRTNKLEQNVDDLNSWRDKMRGGARVVGYIVGAASAVYALIKIAESL